MSKGKRLLIAICGTAALWAFCELSKADYNHTVVGNMNESTYERVLEELAQAGNTDPTEAEIVEWWENRGRE